MLVLLYPLSTGYYCVTLWIVYIIVISLTSLFIPVSYGLFVYTPVIVISCLYQS